MPSQPRPSTLLREALSVGGTITALLMLRDLVLDKYFCTTLGKLYAWMPVWFVAALLASRWLRSPTGAGLIAGQCSTFNFQTLWGLYRDRDSGCGVPVPEIVRALALTVAAAGAAFYLPFHFHEPPVEAPLSDLETQSAEKREDLPQEKTVGILQDGAHPSDATPCEEPSSGAQGKVPQS